MQELDESIDEFESFDETSYNISEDIINKVYNSNDFISKPIKSLQCTLNDDIIIFFHSFGYDCCSKIFNICNADENTVLYASGSYIHMLDINTRKLSFRKCAGNGGIGHIAKNPILNHISVGENCTNPLIIVYEWPTFEVISVLRGGTKQQYNWLTYSQNGKYLCSQGGEPDNTISIWDWEKSRIILRTKSHSQDVYVCHFSNYISDHLTTAGSGHIKFWKMVQTFTGLKLQGRLGRFGKTEISNVIGTYSMPDEKVISGCEWGNILVWDEELIKIQVMRKGRKPCHSEPIIMFLYSEANMELTSVSKDGTVKSWYYYTVNMADPPEKDRVIEIEPSFTLTIEDDIGRAKIMGLCKVNDDINSFDYFLQDGNGGIWLADIEVSANAKPLRRLAKFHGDIITSLQPSPTDYYIATTSLDGWFHLYDIVNKNLIFTHNFQTPITSLIWLPLKVATGESIFVAGFKNGLLKIFLVPLKEIVNGELINLTLLQVTKPHTNSVNHLKTNNNNKIIVSGSEDCSVFVYKLIRNPFKLEPVGFYPFPGSITFICWKPSQKSTALISCASGHIAEISFPTSRPLYTKESFLLRLEPKIIETKSIKSEIIRNQFIKKLNEKKKEKKNRKREKLKILKENNPGVEIDEELYFQDSEEDEEPPKIYVPPVPNPIIFAVYSPNENTVWVSIDGYDSGYLYEYDINSSKLINFSLIPDKIDQPLSSALIYQSKLIVILLMGFTNGRIRLTNIQTKHFLNLEDYIEHSMHDNITGKIKGLYFSHDYRLLYSFGDDGNIFCYHFHCNHTDESKCSLQVVELPSKPELQEKDIINTKEDIKDSLEERKINKEKWKALNMANKEKHKLRESLLELKLKFKNIQKKNMALPESLQLPHSYFELDERITLSIYDEAKLQMDILRSKLAFDLEKKELGLKKVKDYFVKSVLTPSFEIQGISKINVKTIKHKTHKEIYGKLLETLLSKKHPKRKRRKSTIIEKFTDDTVHKLAEWEVFLRNVREIYDSLPKYIRKAIDKYAKRKNFEKTEKIKMHDLEMKKPDITKFDTEEEILIDVARSTIGNLNLKSSSTYKVPQDDIILMEDKYDEYLDVQEEIYCCFANGRAYVISGRVIRKLYCCCQGELYTHNILYQFNNRSLYDTYTGHHCQYLYNFNIVHIFICFIFCKLLSRYPLPNVIVVVVVSRPVCRNLSGSLPFEPPLWYFGCVRTANINLFFSCVSFNNVLIQQGIGHFRGRDSHLRMSPIRDWIFKLKSEFNKKIFELKKQKIDLIQDYKKFLIDIQTIQNELNDPNLVLPNDFPTITNDDDFQLKTSEETCITHHCVDHEYLLIYPEKSPIYLKQTKYALIEKCQIKSSFLENQIKIMREKKLRYKHKCLHELIFTKIEMFDNHLAELETERIAVVLRIKFLELFALTLEEELLILNDYDLLEDEYSYDVYIITEKQNELSAQIINIEEDIRRNYKIIENKNKEAIDVNNLFEIEIRNNSFAKHLRKIFKKKFKPTRVKLDDDDDTDSSSSDESDDSDSDSNDDGSIDSATLFGQMMFDENVLPEGCDPKMFTLTFELRSKRYEIEQCIENVYNSIDLLKKKLRVKYAELDVVNQELQIKIEKLDAFRIEKKLKLNDVETTIILNKNQMNEAKVLSKSVLLYGNIMQNITTRVSTLEKERKDVKESYKKLILHSKRLRIDLHHMEENYKKYQIAIKDVMMKKFKMLINLDNMEMTVIKYMITKAKYNASDLKEQFNKEIDILKEQFKKKEEFLMNVLKINTSKTITFAALQENIRQLQQDIDLQHNKSKSIQGITSNTNVYVADIVKLKDILNELITQKMDISKEIDALKYKGKMFPPIVKSSTDKMKSEIPKVIDSQFITTEVEEEESDEFCFDDYENEYNIEFDLQFKKSTSSKRLSINCNESSKLEKQYSHTSFESTEEKFAEKDWISYEDDIIHDEGLSKSVIEELDQMEKKLSSDEESDLILEVDQNESAHKLSTSFNNLSTTLNDKNNEYDNESYFE
ncbi:cilia- and flagella-associated protein 44 isoform X1 [Daktulosphaira vitifoliae]|uniref:cilia- and flagella-associated protein 44 isoform X1 n=1 Tax=Daktulosphaira vitifoliae TaxID=58002 RepID=UPI0021AAE28D|nr:cilia- and flagella-associated protein 44 isoform X1 [Daktulosphaira vitifoliae]